MGMWVCIIDCCKTIFYTFFYNNFIDMTWKAKKESRNVSKYKNNKSPKKKKKKVINTESNVTLKLIYKCFVVGNNCWGQNFHATWLYFIGNCTTSILSWILGKSISKPKKAHIYTKRRQSPWSKIHGDIISTKPMVQAHGTTSHFRVMI